MATSGNRFGDQDQEVCKNGYRIPVDHADADPNQMDTMTTEVLGARNQLEHANPNHHPTHVQFTLRCGTATNHNSGNLGPVNGSINGYGGAHGHTRNVLLQQTLEDVGLVQPQDHTGNIATTHMETIKVRDNKYGQESSARSKSSSSNNW